MNYGHACLIQREHLGRRAADKPAVVLELGTYCGYSAITLMACLRPNDKLITIESDIACVRYTSEMLAKAGYRVKVIHPEVAGATASTTSKKAKADLDADLLLLHGTAASCIASGQLAAILGIDRVDILFMDHDKAAYLPDLQSLQKSRQLAQTALVVAGTRMCALVVAGGRHRLMSVSQYLGGGVGVGGHWIA